MSTPVNGPAADVDIDAFVMNMTMKSLFRRMLSPDGIKEHGTAATNSIADQLAAEVSGVNDQSGGAG